MVLLGVVAAVLWWPRPVETWVDGSVHGPWLAVFDGEGRTTSSDGTIELSPRPARAPEETHAGLVVSVTEFGDVDFSTDVRTLEQTRVGPPNPWEVGWIVWHYDDHRRFYYFALKPNGWELGKVDPAYPGGQRFLRTGGAPADDGETRQVRVRQLGAVMQVWVDGEHVVTFSDTEDPYLRGAVGVYSEDARVEFSNLLAEPASLG